MKTNFLMMLTALALTFASCGGKATKTGAQTPQAEAAPALEVDAVLAGADSLSGREIELEGICTHICKHGGTKIFVMGSDDTKTLRIEAAELGSFDRKCVNSIVRVRGVLREERIDEAYLQRWEAAAAAQTALAHGTAEAGCESEKTARGETGSSVAERIADFRAKIAARREATGRDYLSFYYLEARAYEIAE